MKKLSYPIPKARPIKITNHNHTREDEYFWMRSDERDNPEILKHLDAENSFCASRMKSLGIDTHTRAILTEMKSYIPQLDESVPARDGEYFYFYRMFDNSDHPVYLRFHVDHPDKIETVLDVNALAATMDYCLVTEWQVSPDGQWLAYALDSDGSEVTQLIFRNLWDASCEEIHTELSADELCWAADNHHLFFTTRDPQWRSDTVWIVDVNHIHEKPIQVFKELDPAFWVSIAASQDGHSLLISIESSLTSEMYSIPMLHPSSNPQCLIPRSAGVEYDADIDLHSRQLFVRSNIFSANFDLRILNSDSPDWHNSQCLCSGTESIKIEGFNIFKNYIVIYKRVDGVEYIDVMNREDYSSYSIEKDSLYGCFEESDNNIWDTEHYRYAYSAVNDPGAVYELNMATKAVSILKSVICPPSFNRNHYTMDRKEIPSHDGVLVPVTMIYRNDRGDGRHKPALVTAYGAYGDIVEPYFRASYISLLDRGFLVVIAHIRGGGYLGEQWRNQGKLSHKENSIHDFIAVGDWLKKNELVHPDKLGFSTSSAGGIVAGAAVNRRPGLFRAGILEVPFVDIISTMTDPELPLTQSEYEEWGDPADKAIYESMCRYSPYDNIQSQDYPALLVSAGLNDPRVGFWEPAKYVARLRTHSTTSPENILLSTSLEGGHFGKSGRDNQYLEAAQQAAFLTTFLHPDP